MLADLRDTARACTWLHLAVVPAHLLLLPAPAGAVVSAVSLAVAACFAVVVLADRVRGLRAAVARHASSLLCAAVVVVCAEMVVYDAVVPLPWASLPVVLGVVAAGGALATRRQVAVVCPATVAAWGLVTVLGEVPVGWLWGALTLGCALGVAALLHVTHHRTMRRLSDAQARVREAALTDELTGLPNRRDFLGRGHGLVGDRVRRGEQAALLFLDLDGLKQVNDRQGHAAGDRLLVSAAAVLRRTAGPRDLVARLAGDEFTVLLDACPPEDVAPRAARLEQALAADGVAVSIGAACLPQDAASLEDLMARADEDMLRVKAARRDPSRGALPDAVPAPRAGGLRSAAAGPRTAC